MSRAAPADETPVRFVLGSHLPSVNALIKLVRSGATSMPGDVFARCNSPVRNAWSTMTTVRFGSVRYSIPPGHVASRVWCRIIGDEFAIVAMTGKGVAEIARHPLSTPGNPRVLDEHYPHHPGGNGPRPPRPRPRTKEEAAFLALGEGVHDWLVEAAASGATRVRAKMARAAELAAIVGAAKVDQALGLATAAGLRRARPGLDPGPPGHRRRPGRRGPRRRNPFGPARYRLLGQVRRMNTDTTTMDVTTPAPRPRGRRRTAAPALPAELEALLRRMRLPYLRAAYVALAELLAATLVTLDARLSRAPGMRCPILTCPG